MLFWKAYSQKIFIPLPINLYYVFFIFVFTFAAPNNTDRNNSTIKTNSNRGNNSYFTPKTNNRSYNSNGVNNRSNSGDKSSKRGGRRSVKPRR